MKKVSKAILLLVAGLVVFLGLLLLGVNLYVQSAAVQTQIQQRLSAELNMPISITGTSYTPWGGVKLTGITVPKADGGVDFFVADHFTADFEYRPLLQRELVLREIVLAEPKVTWVQDESGRWTLPENPEPPLADVSVIPAPLPGVPPVAPGVDPAIITAPAEPFQVRLQKARIRNGEFGFYDRERRPVALLTGVNVTTSTATADLVSGNATSDKLQIGERVTFRKMQTPFSYTRESLDLPAFSAELAGGQVTGGFSMQSEKKMSPFATHANFQQVDLGTLVTEAGGPEGIASGVLQGSLELTGDSRESETITGKGRLVLENGQLQQYELFRTLGQALQIEELVTLQLRQAHAHYRVADGKIFIDELLLASKNLVLRAEGQIKEKGELNMQARLTVNDTISRQLPDFVEANFTQVPETNQRFVDFEVTGTVDDPKTNLVNQMLGNQLGRQAAGLLENILGSKKNEKKEGKKKKKESAADVEEQQP